MAAVSQSSAQTYLDTWVAAQNALAGASSYTFSFPNGQTRTVTRADAGEIRDQIAYWHRVANALAAKSQGLSNPGVRTPRWS